MLKLNTIDSKTKFWILLLAILFSLNTGAQNFVVKGTVKDASGKPLSGVSVTISKTTKGTTTNADGSFSLNTVAEKVKAEFSFIGYKLKIIDLSTSLTNDIVMEESSSVLNEVVLTGYLKQKKSDITGAISSVRNKEFKDQPVSNLAQSIQGKVAGINVTSPSGTPGAGLLVSIRGSNNPLYVVDGVPMISESNSALSTSYNTDGESQGSGQNLSSISDINPDDIENIEILKDASSAAQYGARAANGVVLITTKRGRNGKTEFSFNSFTGIQNVSRTIPFLDSKGLVALIEDARAQDLKLYQKDPSLFPDDFDPSLLTNPLPESWNSGVNTNWLNEIFHTAPISNIQLSARGGNEKTRFFLSGNYFTQQGIVIENSYKRGTFRINLDNKVSDHVFIGANTSFTYSRNRRSFNDDTYTGIVTNAIGASPLEPVYENGTYSDYTAYQASWLSDNPVKSAKEITAFTSNYRFLGTVFAEVNIIENLKFRSSFTTDYTNLVDDQFFSAITTDAEALGGKAIKGIYNSTTWLNENTLTWQPELKGKNDLTALGGFTMQSTRSSQTSLIGVGFPTESGLQNISSAASIQGRPVDFNPAYWGIASFIGRVNYNYGSKYLFSASARYDGSSRFDPNGRWGLFPAFSAGWIISKEALFGESKWLSNLKFRVSYGLTGDQEIDDFEYRSNWTGGSYDGSSGLRPRNLGNPDLTWQRNKMFNIGTDYELWNGKLSGSIEYYKGNRTQLLTEALLPATSGFPGITSNAGNIQNTGFEFSLNAYPIKNKNFTWSISFNTSYLKNKILSLYKDGEQLSAYADLFPTHVLKVGESVGSFIGVEYLGVDQQTGDPIFNDLNKDGVIDESDEKVLGKATPDWYGGITNDFKYKNWDASIVTQFSFGNKVYNLIRSTYQTLGWSDEGWDENYVLYQVYANNATIANNRWQNPGDKTDIPRASLVFQNYLQNSSQFIEDASFFRFRTVSIGYTLKPKTKKAFSSLRFFAQVQNLAVITKYYGFDPEVSSNGGDNPQTAGVDYAAYPQARTMTFGLNFNF